MPLRWFLDCSAPGPFGRYHLQSLLRIVKRRAGRTTELRMALHIPRTSIWSPRRRALAVERLEPRMLLAADFAPSPAVLESVAAGVIEGQVYAMTGDQTAPAAGIAGVEVRLLDETGILIAATQTSGDGGYQFAGLGPGLYALHQVQPQGFATGHETVGAAGGQILAANLIGEIPLAPGQIASGYDFAELAGSGYDTIDGLPPLELMGGRVDLPAGFGLPAAPSTPTLAGPLFGTPGSNLYYSDASQRGSVVDLAAGGGDSSLAGEEPAVDVQESMLLRIELAKRLADEAAWDEVYELLEETLDQSPEAKAAEEASEAELARPPKVAAHQRVQRLTVAETPAPADGAPPAANREAAEPDADQPVVRQAKNPQADQTAA